MERKLSVYIITPEMDDRSNFLIPETMSCETIIRLVCRMLSKRYNTVFHENECQLISCETGGYLDKSSSLRDMSIVDGSELILLGGHHG